MLYFEDVNVINLITIYLTNTVLVEDINYYIVEIHN